MSSPSGTDLESFVEDCLVRPTPALVRALTAALEPWRERIEDAVSDFDADSQSWRDYRNALWDTYVEGNPEANACVETAIQAEQSMR